MQSYQNRKSHCENKMILWTSYLYNSFSYIGEKTFYIEPGLRSCHWRKLFWSYCLSGCFILALDIDTHRPRVHFKYKNCLSGYGNSIVKIRLSWDSLTFTMGITIVVRRHLCIDQGPGEASMYQWSKLSIDSPSAIRDICNKIYQSTFGTCSTP